MKKPDFYIGILIVLMIYACQGSGKVSQKEMNDPKYRFILDDHSKVSQIKMQKMRSKFTGSAVGLSILNGLVTPSYLSESPDAPVYPMGRFFKKITLKNESGFPVYARLQADIRLDDGNNCSVNNIYLPRNEELNLLTVFSEPYRLTFSFEEDLSEFKTYTFIPDTMKTLRVSYEGINKTILRTDTIN